MTADDFIAVAHVGEVADGVPTTTRVFAAIAAGMPLGAITVDENHGSVELVFVQDDLRRRGIATAMLAYARAATGFLLDEDSGDRSPAGHAWAETVGIARADDGAFAPRDLTDREAHAMGSRLMYFLYGATLTNAEPLRVGVAA